MGKIERFSNACVLAALLTTSTAIQGPHATLADTADRGARLGVAGERLDDAWRERENYWSNGILVTQVTPGGAAERIGLQPGDVLVSVGSQILRTSEDLAEAESGLEPGRPVSMVVARNGGRWIRILNADPDPIAPPAADASEDARPELKVLASEPLPVVAEDPDEDSAEADETEEVPVPPVSSAPRTEAFGVRCQAMNAGLASALGIAEPRGLLVLEVANGGIAEAAGIRAGDVISRVADLEVGDPERLSYVLETCPRITTIRTWRQGAVREAKVTFPTRKALLAASRKAAAAPPVAVAPDIVAAPPVGSPGTESGNATEPEKAAEEPKAAEEAKAAEPEASAAPEKDAAPEAPAEGEGAPTTPKAEVAPAPDDSSPAPESGSNRELERMIRDMRQELIQLRNQVRKLRAELEDLKQI